MRGYSSHRDIERNELREPRQGVVRLRVESPAIPDGARTEAEHMVLLVTDAASRR